MKKIIKWICIISCAFLIFGIALVSVGVLLGGKPSWTVNIDTGSFNTVSEENYVEKSFDLDAFSEIDSNTFSEDFQIVKGDDYKIEYRTLETKEPVVEVKNGKLNIDVPKVPQMNFAFNSVDNREYIILTVPDNEDIYDVDIDMTSGSTDIEQINIKGKIYCTSGKLTIKETKAAENLSVELTSGECEIEDSIFNEFEGKLGSGDFAASNIEATKFDYHATSGEGTLKDIKAEKMTTDITSGDLKSENIVCDNFEHTASSGMLKIDTIETTSFSSDILSGDVKVNNMTAEKVDVSASSGVSKLEIVGNQDDYGMDLQAGSGDIDFGDISVDKNLKHGEEKDKQIKVKISSGDAVITFK